MHPLSPVMKPPLPDDGRRGNAHGFQEDCVGMDDVFIPLDTPGSAGLMEDSVARDDRAWMAAIHEAAMAPPGEAVAAMRRLGPVVLEACRDHGERDEIASALRRVGIHPLSVALGCAPKVGEFAAFRLMDRERAAGKVIKVANALGVPKAISAAVNGFGGIEGRKWIGKIDGGWPEGLTVIPTTLHLDGVKRDFPVLPSGLQVGGNLNLDGSGFSALPRGLKVDGWLSIQKCPNWDGSMPDDIMVGGGVRNGAGRTAAPSVPRIPQSATSIASAVPQFDGPSVGPLADEVAQVPADVITPVAAEIPAIEPQIPAVPAATPMVYDDMISGADPVSDILQLADVDPSAPISVGLSASAILDARREIQYLNGIITEFEVENAQLRADKQDMSAIHHEQKSIIESLEHGLGKRTARMAEADSPGLRPSVLQAVLEGSPKLTEALQFLEHAFPDRVRILPDAYRSAQAMDKFPAIGREKAFRLMKTLLTDYWSAMKEGGGDAKARKVFNATDAAFQESETTRGIDHARKLRTFTVDGQDRVFWSHLKVGYKQDSDETWRCHFYWDSASSKILIGHCGHHLDTR